MEPSTTMYKDKDDQLETREPLKHLAFRTRARVKHIVVHFDIAVIKQVIKAGK